MCLQFRVRVMSLEKIDHTYTLLKLFRFLSRFPCIVSSLVLAPVSTVGPGPPVLGWGWLWQSGTGGQTERWSHLRQGGDLDSEKHLQSSGVTYRMVTIKVIMMVT